MRGAFVVSAGTAETADEGAGDTYEGEEVLGLRS